MLYTRKGDSGETDFACGRVHKTHAGVQFIGQLDVLSNTLNVLLLVNEGTKFVSSVELFWLGVAVVSGFVHAVLPSILVVTFAAFGLYKRHRNEPKIEYYETITDLMIAVHQIQSFVATSNPAHNITNAQVMQLEKTIAVYSSGIPTLHNFILYHADGAAVAADAVRVQARVTELAANVYFTTTSTGAEVDSANVLSWLNRLSSLMFAMALLIGHENKKLPQIVNGDMYDLSGVEETDEVDGGTSD